MRTDVRAQSWAQPDPVRCRLASSRGRQRPFGRTPPWSRLGLSEELNALETALRDAVPALAGTGLVVSSTRSMVAGAQSEVVECGASRGLRVAIAPFWARESLILTPNGAASPAAEVWERVVRAEGRWLSATLSAGGFRVGRLASRDNPA